MLFKRHYTSGGAGNAQTALGALQQVSGNEISTQGALATRVAAGQFANISGRLNALRFGSNASLAQGRVAALDDGQASGFGSVAAAGPQSFYLDRSMLDSHTQADGFAPSIAPPLQGFQSQGALTNTAFATDGSLRVAQADSSTAAQSSGNGAAAAPPAGPPNPWGLFVQGSYNSGRHDATSNEDPFNFHAASVSAGIDYNFGTAVLGGSIGYDDYDAGFLNSGTQVSGGSARVAGTSGSLYGAWFGQNWSFSGIATYGRLTTSLARNVKYTATYANGFDPQGDIKDNCTTATCTVTVNNTLRGDPDGNTDAIGVTAGYQYSAYFWDIVPSLSASYRRASFSSFAETAPGPAAPGDGLALAFGDQTVESLRSILGLDLSRPVSAPFGVLTPTIRVEWDHEFKTGVRTIDAHYAYDPSLAVGQCLSCFALPTDASPANYGIAGAGVSVTLAHRLQAFVYDEALFGFTNYHSNSIAIGLRGQF
jgi:uncharacterized protein YhjY with autotransporter beta-barrel domain